MSRQQRLNVRGAPTAPRAMAAASADMEDENIELLEYSNLLYGIHPFQGPNRVYNDDKKVGRRHTRKELRHSFLDSISYLCDTNPQGGTVTAGALNKVPSGAILHLAANEGVPENVRPFIRWVSTILLKDVTSSNREEKEKQLLREAIKMGVQRVDSYYRKMRIHLRKCHSRIDEVFAGHRVLLWIRNIENETNRHRLAKLCYDARGRELDELKSRGRTDANSDLSELAHYIGRLGAHKYAVSMIMSAAINVSVLREIVDVNFLRTPEEKVVELPQESADFHTVTRKLCTGPHIRHSRHELYSRLYLQNSRCEFALEDGLRERNVIKTRVHAELQVVDYFSRKKLDFVDGDKYVGCSKPACYLCYKWISLHHGGFSLPESHNKVILGWRGPDVNVNEDVNGNGARIRRELCARVKRDIARDIEEQLRTEPYNTMPRHLSSNGSSRAPSLIASAASAHR